MDGNLYVTNALLLALVVMTLFPEATRTARRRITTAMTNVARRLRG